MGVIMKAGDGRTTLLQGKMIFTPLTLETKYDVTNGSCIWQICENITLELDENKNSKIRKVD